MIRTPIKLFRIPSSHRAAFGNRYATSSIEDYVSIQNFIIHISGGSVDKFYDPFHCKIDYPMDELNEHIKIESIDNHTILVSKSKLIRYFQFFDDYLHDYPDADSVKLKFPIEIIEDVLVGDGGKLTACYKCLCFCNPKDPSHYLIFNTKGANISLLYDIYNKLTEENRSDILEARRHRGDTVDEPYLPPLPRDGVGMGIIAHVLEIHGDYDNLKTMFTDYPSYLLFTLPDEERLPLLFSSDFSREYDNPPSTIPLSKMIGLALTSATTREDLKRIMNMIRMVHPVFENDDSYVTAPYNIDMRLSMILGWRSETVVSNISRLFEIDREKVELVLRDLR